MKPKVAVITTGGTIAGVSYGEAYEVWTGQKVRSYKVALNGEELLKRVPTLEDIARIELRDLGSIDSANMKPANWQQIATTVFEYIQRDDISGVVVTHGTDTLEFTSMALAMMVQNPNKPIVTTGTILPFDQDPRHVQRHLEDSVTLAAYSTIPTVSVCFSGDMQSNFTVAYNAVHAWKLKSRGSDAFGSPLSEPFARVVSGEILLSAGHEAKLTQHTPSLHIEYDDVLRYNVMSPFARLGALDSSESYPVLLSSEGPAILGNKYREAFIRKHLDAGNPVALASNSFKDLQAYRSGHALLEAGTSFVGKLPPNKALVKLGWASAQAGGDVLKTKEIMHTDYAGELANVFASQYL